MDKPMGGPAGSPIAVSVEPRGDLVRPALVRTMTLLLLCLVIGLAGCARLGGGGAASGGPSDGKPDDPVSGTPGPEPPGGDGALREEPDATVFGAHAAAVDHFTIGPDGRTVVVYWWGGNSACFGLKEVRVEVQRGAPVLTVLEGTRASARDQMCTMEAVLKSTVVVLDEPILTDAANPDAAPGAAVTFDGAMRVKAVSGVTDARPHAVSGFSLSPDGLTLSAYYVGGVEECYALASATATREGVAGLLTVSIREGWIAADDVACDDIGVTKVVELTLGVPLMVDGTDEA
jgi:hypothetical protein